MTNERSPAALRWGVLGAARILGKLLPALRSAGGSVVAIGASTQERADAAARDFGIERAYEGYAAVLDDDSVDAVYLPLANHLHRKWLLAAADAGKHCLCEKPLVLSAADAVEARARFRDAGCRLQEAFMWRHHPQAPWLLDRFAAGDLGSPRRVHATFSFPLARPDDYRWRRSTGGGVLWDIGCYGLNAARYFFGAEPVAASMNARFRPGDDGVDETAAGWIDFGEERVATLSISFASAFAQGLEVVGTEGRARLDRPWLSVGLPTRVEMERGFEQEEKRFEPTDAYSRMVEHFARRVAHPSLDLAPAEDGLPQAVAMEGLLDSARRSGDVWRSG